MKKEKKMAASSLTLHKKGDWEQIGSSFLTNVTSSDWRKVFKSKTEKSVLGLKSNCIDIPNHPSTWRGRGEANGFVFGTGPPGRSRSPGFGFGKPPDKKAGPPRAQIQIENEVQYINNTKNSNYYKHLIFLIMKKQILFLMVFVLAAFANVNKSYGQCTPDPLHPAAGVAYDYSVTISGTAGASAPIYHWYVTKDVNILLPGVTIIAAGVDFTVGGSGSVYNSAVAAGTTSTLNLTWTSAAVASATPYYLVVKYTETSAIGCTVENMKVWMIDPVNSFLLAVAGSDAAGVVANNSICAANVDGALITAGASPTVAYTYGQNTLYYKVTASGSIGTWTPSIRLPALAGLGQNYNSADWSSDGGTTWNSFGLTDGDLDGGDFTSAVTTAPVSVAGSVTMIRIRVDNVNYETLAAQPIVLGVDGILPGPVNDIVSATDCADEAAFGKTGTFTVNPRPTVADNTTDVPNTTNFITKAP